MTAVDTAGFVKLSDSTDVFCQDSLAVMEAAKSNKIPGCNHLIIYVITLFHLSTSTGNQPNSLN